MTRLLFPAWQVEHGGYEAICAYLELAPDAKLYERLSGYLAEAPFRFARPIGFARRLAELELSRWRIARLDLATKLFFPRHPFRHVLNCTLALHECTESGYRQLSRAPQGKRVFLALACWLAGFAANLAVTLSWLGWQFACHAVGPRESARDNLAGKRVLLTGAGGGLGRDLMLLCLESGAEVIGVVRTREGADAMAGQLPAAAPIRLLAADLSKPGALREALAQAQIAPTSVSLAVACAGVKREGRSIVSLPDLRETFEVNLFSVAELAGWLNEPGSEGAQARSTALVLVSSMGRWHGMHSTCGYNASKAALSIWGESLAMELRHLGNSRLTVTVVEPGMFASGMVRGLPVGRFLFSPRRDVARGIVSAGLRGKPVIRPPFWFAALTWAVCLLGREVRSRLFARAKPHPLEP